MLQPLRLAASGLNSEDYDYELRRGDAIIATGRLNLESPTVGDRIRIGSDEGIIQAVVPRLRDQPARIQVHLLRP